MDRHSHHYTFVLYHHSRGEEARGDSFGRWLTMTDDKRNRRWRSASRWEIDLWTETMGRAVLHPNSFIITSIKKGIIAIIVEDGRRYSQTPVCVMFFIKIVVRMLTGKRHFWCGIQRRHSSNEYWEIILTRWFSKWISTSNNYHWL